MKPDVVSFLGRFLANERKKIWLVWGLSWIEQSWLQTGLSHKYWLTQISNSELVLAVKNNCILEISGLTCSEELWKNWRSFEMLWKNWRWPWNLMRHEFCSVNSHTRLFFFRNIYPIPPMNHLNHHQNKLYSNVTNASLYIQQHQSTNIQQPKLTNIEYYFKLNMEETSNTKPKSKTNVVINVMIQMQNWPIIFSQNIEYSQDTKNGGSYPFSVKQLVVGYILSVKPQMVECLTSVKQPMVGPMEWETILRVCRETTGIHSDIPLFFEW